MPFLRANVQVHESARARLDSTGACLRGTHSSSPTSAALALWAPLLRTPRAPFRDVSPCRRSTMPGPQCRSRLVSRLNAAGNLDFSRSH